MILHAAVASDIGKVRSRNEDAFLVLPEIGLFAVADGMGGHAAGDVASRTAVDAITSLVRDRVASVTEVVAAVQQVNRAVWQRAQHEPQYAGMGTTLTIAAFARDAGRALIGHVGDTRLYRMRNNSLFQLTRDHTAAQDMVEAGQLTSDAARGHPASSMLHRAVGTHPEVDVDSAEIDVQSNDLFLLCSDGLTGMLSDNELTHILKQEKPLQQLTTELIEAANLHGGLDNITSLLVRAD